MNHKASHFIEVLNKYFQNFKKSDPTYSLRKLARKSDVSVGMMSNFMRNLSYPSHSMMNRISRNLGFSNQEISYILLDQRQLFDSKIGKARVVRKKRIVPTKNIESETTDFLRSSKSRNLTSIILLSDAELLELKKMIEQAHFKICERFKFSGNDRKTTWLETNFRKVRKKKLKTVDK